MGLRQVTPLLDLLQNPLPRNLGIDDKFIPNLVFNLREMSLFLVKHFVVTLNPNSPKSDPSK